MAFYPRSAWLQRADALLEVLPKERWLTADEIAGIIAPTPFDKLTKAALTKMLGYGMINRTNPDIRSGGRKGLRYWIPPPEQTAALSTRLCLRCRREFTPDHRHNFICRPCCSAG